MREPHSEKPFDGFRLFESVFESSSIFFNLTLGFVICMPQADQAAVKFFTRLHTNNVFGKNILSPRSSPALA